MAKARRTKKPVPVPALTTETTDVTAKPGGRLVATIHNKPVRTRVGGKWKPIDPSLRKLADGSVAPRVVTSNLRFSGGGTRPLVRMSSAGKQLELTWPGRLPVPVVRSATAVYESVLPGVDLRMTATDTGFTQLLVVKSAKAAQNPALARLTLGLGNSDLNVQVGKDGSLAAVDPASGGTVFTAAAPVMYDSTTAGREGAGLDQSGRARTSASPTPTGSPKVQPPGHASEHVARLALGTKPGSRSLTLTPDRTLLADPDTVYPVTIDPNWQTPHAGGWAGISKHWSNNSYWKFSDDFGTGYCPDTRTCVAGDVKRVLYAMPIKGGPLVGKHILYAEFGVHESWAYNCTARPVQLYATNRISSHTTWGNSSSSAFWPDHLQTINAAKGWSSSCPAGYLEFGGTSSTTLRSKVQAAANGNWYDVTLGLKAQDEGSSYGYEWKRFASDAFLRVEYNLPPRQIPMSALSMSPGSACQASTVAITKWPQVTARPTDPDDDRIGVQFAAAWTGGDGVFKRRWWSTGAEGTRPPSNSFKASGSLFSMTLPSSSIPRDQTVGWEARAWDGAEWGPWSSSGPSPTDCYFRVDTSRPVGPALSSESFPGSPDATADLPWTNGVGRYGTFTMDSASTDVVKYQYALDQMPSSAHEKATSNGAAQSVHLLMTTEGPHFFAARALDAAGNASEPTVYYFLVSKGDPQRSGWSMDDPAGTARLAATGRPITATASSSGVTVGAPGHTGQGLRLSGTVGTDGGPEAYAATDAAVLDTDDSFTVSAWANLADGPGAYADHSLISQNGTLAGAFELGVVDGAWTFQLRSEDTGGVNGPGAPNPWTAARSTKPVATGQWTHVTGVYNAAAKTATVYVDGEASAPVAVPASWNARGPLQLGRYLHHTLRTEYVDGWQGGIDDVRVWDRALPTADVADLAAGHAMTTGLSPRAVWPLDETSGTTLTSTPVTSDAVVSGQVTAGVKGAQGTAVRFGAGGYARTDRPQVDATRSFAVAAWVRLAPPPADDPSHMVLIQNGVHNGEFVLYYSTWYKRWVFGRYSSDSSTAALTRAMQPDCTVGSNDSNGVPCMGPTTGQWTHLVGVSDARSHQLRLYVNGYLVSTTGYTQTSAWPNPGPLQIGANNTEGTNDQFFGGDIDDVRVFDRVVSGPEVEQLVQRRPTLAGRWKLNQASGIPPVSPDDLTANPVTLSGNATIDPSSAYVGSGALSLDGTNGYASTTASPLHTGQSFTIAGWAQTAGAPNRDMTVWSIGDGTDSALTVRWDYQKTVTDPYTNETVYVGQWQVETADDSSPRVRTGAVHSYQAPADGGSRWNHLAVTYDAFAHQLSLYADGQLEDQVCDDEDTSGTCTDHVSFTGAPQPFEATSGLQLGRDRSGGAWSEYFSGQLDDVWAYQGVLSQGQIGKLADGEELDSSSGP
ncbi:LamG domain-containing protein [Actinomadura meridiana]|uniref:LamG domain-containing protein n=1 Tax=Actinomadura meridiana TaxID=559626 RepID=A0ABP8C811_9ACTN